MKTETARERMARKRAAGYDYDKARSRAIKRLIDIHRAEFERLLFEERSAS